jgi:hypothetical protein
MPNLRVPLFMTRIFIFYFMFMWALDRFMAPDHAAKVAEKFYSIGPLSLSAIPPAVTGGAMIVLLLAFVVGFTSSSSNLLILDNILL